MSVQELIEAVHASGATIRTDGQDLKIKPVGRVPEELKAKLREHKADLVKHLQNSTAEVPDDIVSRAAEGPNRTWPTDTPDDYEEKERLAIENEDIQIPRDLEPLTERERHILREFQRRFKATIEWRKP